MFSSKNRLDYILNDGIVVRRNELISKTWLSLNDCAKCDKIIETTYNSNYKYSAGATLSTKSKPFRVSKKQYLFRSNISVPSICFDGISFCMFPDSVYAVVGKHVVKIPYSQVHVSSSRSQFREYGKIPKDADVINRVWENVNKDGSQDLRFKNNRLIPVCNYYKLDITWGVYKLSLLCSNVSIAKAFENNLRTISTLPALDRYVVKNEVTNTQHPSVLESTTNNNRNRKIIIKKILLAVCALPILFFSLVPLIGGWDDGGYVGAAIGSVHTIPAYFLYYMMYRGQVTYATYALIYLATFFGTTIVIFSF